jgi:hypothetical protein
MKGVIADWIRSVADFVTSESRISYKTTYDISALNPNDLITKAMFIDGPFAQITTPIMGGVTPNPVTITYGAMINPTIILRNNDGSNYSGSANNVDNGTEIVLTGDDNGSGKFADTFNIILKQ